MSAKGLIKTFNRDAAFIMLAQFNFFLAVASSTAALS
jgi:hypothetical protein